MSRILVLGGSGFVGRHIVRQLVDDGHFVVVPTRRRERAKHLILLPTVDVVEADVHDPKTLERLMAGCDAVVNLVGFSRTARRSLRTGFRARPRRAAAEDRRSVQEEACAAPRPYERAERAPEGSSQYLRSKGDGETWVFSAQNDLAVTAFRPSVIFGPEDRFLNTFAWLQRWLPLLLLPSPGRASSRSTSATWRAASR